MSSEVIMRLVKLNKMKMQCVVRWCWTDFTPTSQQRLIMEASPTCHRAHLSRIGMFAITCAMPCDKCAYCVRHGMNTILPTRHWCSFHSIPPTEYVMSEVVMRRFDPVYYDRLAIQLGVQTQQTRMRAPIRQQCWPKSINLLNSILRKITWDISIHFN